MKAPRIHLNPAQRAAILALIARYPVRPTPEEYAREECALRAIPTAPKPKRKAIPNTAPGFEPGDVKLAETFDARRDLPPGWAMFSRYDSGGNHGLENAAVTVWRNVWNGWRDGAPYDITAKAALPGAQGETVSALLDSPAAPI